MSNELKKLVKSIQFRTDKTIEEIAKEIGYARAYFTNQVNIGTNKKLKELLMERFPSNNEHNVLNEPTVEYDRRKDNIDEAHSIELKTASGKTLYVIPEGVSEIALLNAFLEERNRIISEKEERKLESDARAERAEKDKERLYGIIEKYLVDIHSNSKEIVDDISALTIEIQAEHRAMMDTMDVAAKQPIGTTRAAAGTVELASGQEHLNKGKKTGIDKKADMGKRS